MNRNEMLAQLQQTAEWDIVVIGGGATGLGCAVDAASRGYKTLLAEQYDFGKGTSGRSTKLVHGGVRYLARGNIKLVMEALRERAYLLRNAPHVTAVQAFIVPVYSLFDKWFYGVGLKMYDLLSGKLSIGKTRWLSRQQTLLKLQGLSDHKLKGGILYYDGQFDDTRLAIDLAQTAASCGATILNYCKATAFIKNDHHIAGVVVQDVLHNKSYTVKSKVIINATGVFADTIMQLDEPQSHHLIAPSQGIHVVVDKSFFPANNALMIPKTDDGRVLFAVPWHNKVLLGTTDTPVAQIAIEPTPLQEEINFVLQHANKYLVQAITKKDILSIFAGLRPLIKKQSNAATSMLSRDHTIIVSAAGLVTVSGGKWTTYRKMAEDVINKAISLGKLVKKECVTKHLPIVNLCKKNDSGYHYLHPEFPYATQHIDYFVQHEMAMIPEDILARRTRILFLHAKVAVAVVPLVAKQMAALLQKDEDWVQEQVKSFTELAGQYYIADE